jgi:hypothetical protein
MQLKKVGLSYYTRRKFAEIYKSANLKSVITPYLKIKYQTAFALPFQSW